METNTSRYANYTEFTQGGLNKKMIRDINVDGAEAYDLKGHNDDLPVNQDSYIESQQDQFLSARTAQVRLKAEAARRGLSFK